MAERKASEGLKILRKQTAGPRVKATVTVDQVYARFQHEGLDLKHPHGGQAKYLEAPMFAEHDRWLESFARVVLDVEETADMHWARRVGEPLKGVVPKNAPVELEALRESTGLVVKVGTKPVLIQPPLRRRLTEDELRANTELARSLGLD